MIDELFNCGKFHNNPTQLVVNLKINYHDISLRFFASPILNHTRCWEKYSMLTLLQGTDITVQELHPLMLAHVHQQGVQHSNTVVTLYK